MDAPEPPVASPCVNVCVLDAALGHCIGCGRTLEEIADWTRASEARKREIVALAAARVAPG